MTTPDYDPAALAAIDPAILAAALAASQERAAADEAAAAAAALVADRIREGVQHLAGLAAAASAAGLAAPDMTATLAAAMERAVPVDPATLAGVIAPDPAPVVAPAAPTGRRHRNRVERIWTDVPRGSVWTATLAGQTGKVRIYVNNGRPVFTVITGPQAGLTVSSPSRAVQHACGNPAGAGRRGEATVNGFLALERDGVTLDTATTLPV